MYCESSESIDVDSSSEALQEEEEVVVSQVLLVVLVFVHKVLQLELQVLVVEDLWVVSPPLVQNMNNRSY
jgi:hypothetical protein